MDLIAHDLAVDLGGRRVLAGVAATLRPGRVTAILGPNGAGKSTLLKALAGLIAPAAAMRQISQELAAMSLGERAQLPCIGRERADLVVAGCAILEGILDLWPAERLGIADRGIREGILRRLMGERRP